MKTRLITFALLGATLLCSADFALAQSWTKHEIQFFAHRGSRFEFDENTLDAFRQSYAAGVRGFETDFRLNKDGNIILNHDASLYRTCGVDVQVEELTDAQCRKVRTLEGHQLTFAEDLLEFFADKEGLYVEFEIKTSKEMYTQAKLDELCDKAYKLVMSHRHPSSQYFFTSFDKRALTTMQRLHPDAPLIILINKPCSTEVLMEAYDMGIMRVGCRIEGTTRKAVDLGHKLGMFISLWPGQCKEDFMLGVSLGADALCCDCFVEVSSWAKEAMPFVKLKGVAR